MKKLNYVKIVIDTIMAVVFTLLFNKMVLGMQFHEVAGLAIAVIVLVHCGLNWRWIKSVTLKVLDKKLPIKTRLGYIVDLLLLISFLTIIISGVFISKVVFAGLALGENRTFKFLHITVAYWSLILVGIHIGLHWNWVSGILNKLVKVPQKKIFNYSSKVIVIFILVFGIYSINSVGLISKISLASPAAGPAGNKIERNIGAEVGRAPISGSNQSLLPNQHSKAHAEQNGNISVLSTIVSYLGVIAVFAIVTVYIEKLLKLITTKKVVVTKDKQ